MLKSLLNSLCLLPLIFIFFLPHTQAQIIPDRSLDNEQSKITPNVKIKGNSADLIEGGATRNSNLFHSFQDFNISEGSRVYFANPQGIENIFSRVTGNNLSQILGTLGVNGNANLFLINPNGILFGNNARLDLKGSFVATTAESILFNDRFSFSTNNPRSIPLLTINLPIGLQFDDRAESIINKSQTQNNFQENIGLKVRSGQNITLVGGNIQFEGGYLTVPNGSIEIGSVEPHSLVKIVPTEKNWTLNYDAVNTFKNISLTQSSVIDSSGNGAGNINIQANNLSVLEGSFISADNLGEIEGGSLTIQAKELVEVRGKDADGFYSYISTDIYDRGKGANLSIKSKTLQISDEGLISATTNELGNTGNIDLEVENLSITNGAQLFTGTFGSGNAGDINIKANSVEVIATNKVDIPTGIFVGPQPDATGNGGNLYLKADNLLISKGGQIASATFSSGNAGNIVISVSKSLKINGTGFSSNPEIEDKLEIFSSGLFASVQDDAKGNAGNLIIETGDLIVTNGGKIVALTLGSGNAGNVFIRANNLEVRGTVIDNYSGTRSGINSTVELLGTGNGGNVEIITNNLRLINGGSIAVDAKGNGTAGNLTIDAQNINISGVSSGKPVFGIEQPKLPSQISAFSQGDFKAGSININTNNFNLSDRGNISVSNLGNGDAGNIKIETTKLNLDNQATIEAQVNAGNEGNINLNSNLVFLKDRSQITTNATGEATGGNIQIETTNLFTLGKSQITANSTNSFGGKIQITSQGQFISSDSQITAFGKNPEFNGIVEFNTPDIDPSSGLVKLSTNILNPNQQINPGCYASENNQFTIVGKGGLPPSPLEQQTVTTLWQDLRFPIASNSEPKAYNSSENITNRKPVKNIVEARGWSTNQQGKIELIANIDADNTKIGNFSCQ